MTPRIFRYVVRYDSGVAPRPFGGYCTLAICKPAIRAHARVGDWVIGFRTRAPGDVVYVMKVEEVLSLSDYWMDPRFRDRRPGASAVPDNIYRPNPYGRLSQEPNRVHGEADVMTDLSGRNVLVSKKFWYFGSSSPVIPAELVHLIHTGIGHAVDKGRRASDIEHLERWVSFWKPGIFGEPLDRSLVAQAADAVKCRRKTEKSVDLDGGTARIRARC